MELVRLKVESSSCRSAAAAARATKKIPNVCSHLPTHGASGIVASLARPGGNVTGLTHFPLS